MISKKAYLDYLYYDIGKQNCDFMISGLTRTNNGDISTKWYKYSQKVMPININESYKLMWVNQRQILPNEIVIDLEEKKTIKDIIIKLKKYNQSYKIFDTGSRGYHIHIFYNFNLTEIQKQKFIKLFGADEQLNSKMHMINLEYSKHWKSGKIKMEINEDEL